MSKEIAAIDTSPIEALVGIKAKQDELHQLVARAESARTKVSDAVYRRVLADYETRGRQLEAEAKPLRRKARQEHARLTPIHERLRRQVEEARLDKEELEFRHEVGELADDAFAEGSKAAAERLAEREREFAEADELSQRLVAVMGAPEAEPEPAPARPPARPAEAEVTHAEQTATLPRFSTGEAASAAGARDDSAEKTAFIPPDALGQPAAGEAGGAPRTEGTMVMRFASLLAEGGGEEYQLGLRTAIGRTPDNDITIASGLVSRRHAVITQEGEGYVIADLKSGNGTFVNGQRIERHTLANGDQVKIGPTAFAFREG